VPYPYNERDARDFIAGAAVGKALAIVHANGVIGVIGLEPVGEGEAELGYWLGKPFWGRGFVTEAGHAVIASSLQSCPTMTVTSNHFEDNPASGHVLAKLGFIPTGERMIRSIARGADVRALTYRLSRSTTLDSSSPLPPRP
jgi:RimJ/RimL family protein N-acetyltransferase